MNIRQHIRKMCVYNRFLLLGILFSPLFIFSYSKGQEQQLALEEMRRQAFQTIEGAKVATCQEAQRLGFQAYIEKMKCAVSDFEGGNVKIITLESDISGFGTMGDKVWEFQVVQYAPADFSERLRAVLLIHPSTAEIYYLWGPWNK